MNIYFFVGLILLNTLDGCYNRKGNYRHVGNDIILFAKNDDGRVIYEKYLTKDLLQSHKSETYYYNNGNIKRYIWHTIQDSLPIVVYDYDSLKQFIKYNGRPFVRVTLTELGNTAVEFIPPPYNNYNVVYEDYRNDTLLKREVVSNFIKTDSSMWLVLKEHEYDKAHKYYLNFYIRNNSIEIDSNKFELLGFK